MGTLGKILLVVNFFVAAGLAYLIARDWAARQNVSAVIARSALAIDGLPVAPPPSAGSGVPVNAEIGGLHIVETVRPELLAAHFEGAEGGQTFGGGGAPESQIKVLEWVRSKVDAQLASAASPVEKLALLAGRYDAKRQFAPGWLAKMAESYDERKLVRALAEAALPPAGAQSPDPQVLEEALKTAQAMLDRRFEAVRSAPNPQAADQETTQLKELAEAVRKADEAGRQANTQLQNDPANQAAQKALNDAILALENALKAQKDFFITAGNSASRNEEDRRRRIAHLLTHLEPDAAWQKRVALVVGLRTYLAAIQDQVHRLRDMASSAQQQVVLDQADFSEHYENLKRLARERALLLHEQKDLTADLAEQRRRDQEAVTQRAGQLQRRLQEFQELQDQVAAALKQQTAIEQALLDVQRQVDKTQRNNLEMLEKVDAAEQKK